MIHGQRTMANDGLLDDRFQLRVEREQVSKSPWARHKQLPRPTFIGGPRLHQLWSPPRQDTSEHTGHLRAVARCSTGVAYQARCVSSSHGRP